jgi:hypothetical protein
LAARPQRRVWVQGSRVLCLAEPFEEVLDVDDLQKQCSRANWVLELVIRVADKLLTKDVHYLRTSGWSSRLVVDAQEGPRPRL